MAWQSSRTVPWKRLLIEWAIVATAISVIFSATGNGKGLPSMIIVSAFAYLGMGYVMSKFGYARKSLRQLREESAAQQAARTQQAQRVGAAPRPKPAPTKRTSSGPSNRPAKKRR